MTKQGSPNATKQQMQFTIELLRMRGDLALVMVLSELDFLIARATGVVELLAKIKECDAQLGIDSKAIELNSKQRASDFLGEDVTHLPIEQVAEMVYKHLVELKGDDKQS